MITIKINNNSVPDDFKDTKLVRVKDILELIDEWAKDKLPQKEVKEKLPVPKELKGFVKPMVRKTKIITILHKDHIEELKAKITENNNTKKSMKGGKN